MVENRGEVRPAAVAEPDGMVGGADVPLDAREAPPAVVTGGIDEPVSASRLQSRYIPALDGWRGVAVFVVMLYHMWPWRGGHCPWFTSFGWMGVDLFFVLSGFLITRILLAARDKPRYFRNFYARRTLRIFPLYYGVVLAVLILWPMFGPARQPAREALPHAAVALGYFTNLWQAYWSRWYEAPVPFHVGHLWSLAVEEQFYLVWPVVVLLVSNRRWLLATCGACVAITAAYRLALWAAHANPMAPFVLTPCRLDGLGLGAALAVVATEPRWAATARTLSRVALWACLPVVVVIGLRSHTWDHTSSYIVRTVGLSLSAPLCASALFLTVVAPRGSLPDRALSLAPLRWFGKYSYGLYLYHGLLTEFLEVHVGTPATRHIGSPFLSDLCSFLLCATTSAAIAVVSFHVFEQPILRLKRFFPEPLSPDEKTGYR